MIVVIPVCHKDEQLVLKNLEWVKEMDGTDFGGHKINCCYQISCPIGFDSSAISSLCSDIFSEVRQTIRYDDWKGDPNWPNPQNWAWQATARSMMNQKLPWLWWEADAIPTVKGWYNIIKSEYEAGQKPFMGCIMDEGPPFEPHMNGVGVYPANIAVHSVSSMLCRAAAFDIVLWRDIKNRTHRANQIIQHHARENGDSTHFPDQASVDMTLTPSVVLFHRCKDGSLIDRLRERKGKGLFTRLTPKWVDPPKKKTVIPIIAHLDASSGYGIFASQTASELLKIGYEIEIFPPSYNEIHGKLPTEVTSRIKKYSNPHKWGLIIFPCVIQPGNLVLDQKDYAFVSMWESTRLHSTIEPKYTKAVERFNKCKVVITPNSWNASCFNSCGVNKPIRICPMGFDPDTFPLCANDPKEMLVFGTAAKTASGGVRKGFNIVVEAFRKAFPIEIDVRLKLKAFQEDPPLDTQGDTRIEVLQRYINQSELVEWYRSLNVFVSGSASEGWGRHQHEAMAMGRPVVGIDFGGVCEFFSRENGYAVDFTLVPAEGIYRTMGLYAKPSVESMAEQMARAYKDRKELKIKSVMAAASARKLTMEHSMQTLIKILKEFGFPV